MEHLKTSKMDKRFQVLDVSWRSNDRPIQHTFFMEFSPHLVACSLRNMAKFASLETLAWEQGLNRANYPFALKKKNPSCSCHLHRYKHGQISAWLFWRQCSSEADPLKCIGRWAAQNKSITCEQKHIESVNKIILKRNGNMVELNCDISYTLNEK